jgi:hypothetical protein
VQLIDRDHCLSSANTTPGKPKESMIPNYGDHLDKQFLVERFPQQQRVQFIWTETKRLKYDRDYHRKQTNRVQGAKLSAMDAATHFLSPIAKLRALFPDGGSLPEEVWQKRYNFLLGLTWLHALVIALIGPVLGYSWELSVNAIFSDYTVMHTVFEGLLVALFAALGSVKRIRRTFQAASVALGLMSASAILVHLSGGYIEFHFHFFVMLVFLALLQDWVPYLLAVAYVGIHHGLVGALWPEEVFNHTAAINAPWTWAGIHAFFILWAAVGSIIAWRFNEKMLEKIKKQAAELEEANKLQADFAAMIAHDLRGPVSTVLNTAELMQDGVFGEVSDDQKEWLGKMQVTCRTVVDIVSDFLDISKIEAGKLELIKKKIDLYHLPAHSRQREKLHSDGHGQGYLDNRRAGARLAANHRRRKAPGTSIVQSHYQRAQIYRSRRHRRGWRPPIERKHQILGEGHRRRHPRRRNKRSFREIPPEHQRQDLRS